MNRLRRRSPGRIAMMIMVIVLLITVCAALYLVLERRLRPVGSRLASGELTRQALGTELTLLLVILLGSVLLILIFVIGSYLFIRVGRAVSQKRVGGEPTKYVDAWSRYRLTEEQIEAATQEEANRDEDRDEPPDNSPPHPDPKS